MDGDTQDDLVARLAAELPPDSVDAYVAFATRTRSPLAPRVLRAGGHHAAYGRLLALSGDPDAHEKALALLDQVVSREGISTQTRETATVYAQLLVRTARTEELQALLADPQAPLDDLDRWSLRTDARNPHRPGPLPPQGPAALAAAENAWLAVLNEIHLADDLEPVQLRPAGTGENPYQRLAAPTSDRVDGELVTVVMSAYQPDQDLLLAVRGVMEQTWGNIELLVVDDASPAGSEQVLEQAEALDPRVRVVRARRNSGTYEARNLALRLAQGRWMTFQDSDDWTHPRRVELQVRHLLENPTVLANRTWTLRAYEDLTLSYVGYPAARLNASSLLFDRVPVQQLVGQFDSVRKSADMELPFRLQALRRGSVRDLRHPAPLAITQLRSGSLSRADAVPGWLRWDRLAYRDGYMEWHDQVRTGRQGAVLPAADGSRPFPLPRASWAPDRPATPPTPHWQVVVLGDLRNGQPRAPRTIGVARAAHDAGLRVALSNTESPTPLAPRRESPSRSLAHDIRVGWAGVTNPHEADRVDLLVVTDPASLLHLDTASLRVQRVLVVADDAEPSGWSVPAVDQRCRALFGVLPTWGGPAPVHDGPDGRSVVRAAVPEPRWAAEDLALVTGARWPQVPQASRPRPDDGTLRIGHHLRDYVARWPRGPKVLGRAYPVRRTATTADGRDLTVEVRALGGLSTPTAVLRRALPPPTWLSFLDTGMTVREFLSHLDVWVYYGRWDLHAEIAALEALAAGLPCVLPEEAAASGLVGAVRCVDPRDSTRAAVELLEAPQVSDHSARRRFETWAQLLHRLAAAPPADAEGPQLTEPVGADR